MIANSLTNGQTNHLGQMAGHTREHLCQFIAVDGGGCGSSALRSSVPQSHLLLPSTPLGLPLTGTTNQMPHRLCQIGAGDGALICSAPGEQVSKQVLHRIFGKGAIACAREPEKCLSMLAVESLNAGCSLRRTRTDGRTELSFHFRFLLSQRCTSSARYSDYKTAPALGSGLSTTHALCEKWGGVTSYFHARSMAFAKRTRCQDG